MLLDHLPLITPATCESPRPGQEHPRPWRSGSVFDHGEEFRRPISSNSRAQMMERGGVLERSIKAPGQRDAVLGPSTPMVRRGRYCAISVTSRAAASATSFAHSDIVLKYFKHSVSTDCQNPGTILRCGAESLRTTTIKGVIEAHK